MVMGSSKSKRNNGVWCVLLVGLLLAAVVQGEWCDLHCLPYAFYPDKYRDCIIQCRGGVQRHLKRVAGGTQEEERMGDSLPTTAAEEKK
jgi:hypothetical protein